MVHACQGARGSVEELRRPRCSGCVSSARRRGGSRRPLPERGDVRRSRPPVCAGRPAGWLAGPQNNVHVSAVFRESPGRRRSGSPSSYGNTTLRLLFPLTPTRPPPSSPPPRPELPVRLEAWRTCFETRYTRALTRTSSDHAVVVVSFA